MDEQGSAPLSLLVFAVMHNDRDRHNSGVSVELIGRIIFFDALLARDGRHSLWKPRMSAYACSCLRPEIRGHGDPSQN